ncbi:uncharacterized protein J8A68_000559 [[Candida] subhashii]|uniref:Nucleoporin Nup133/Nup155-like N-terminal domain-containing protein n=1 Tax=[Candida] subhashii TaxID=561895 RepID=A0A8J5QST5_9ASCO|nr:uncharacterized protein J8A68_000559 [[Candida] subhashii]KAG7665936.1 hypothetical protein J8A68_000559 [[Candida] subhashii]
MSGSIFRARQSQSPTVSADSTTKPQSALDNTLTDITRKSGCYELTKNKHYCVSRFPALPKVFKQLKSSDQSFSNAYSDHESNYSLVINEDSIYVWSYKSLDSSPLSIEFPIEKPQFELPLAILTKPSSGTGQDPGLVIIDSLSGLIKFYESVQHAPTLGLINDRSLEMNIPINTSKGEYITLAENVEPAGIAVATSWKRCILIQLRDYKSKPQLSTMELLSAPSSFSFLSKIFRSPSEDSNEINLFLLTIKIDPSGVLLYGCHKLTRFDPGSKLSSSPKLYLPQPGKTAFVIIDNSIIITDLNTSYIESRTTFVSYYKPRWEDMIRLKSSVEIIGSGYENQSSNSNPAIVLLTKNYGILRLEKFPQESYDEDSMETNETDISDPLLIVKSHIEQGIFYSHSQEIEFDLSQKFDESLILSAIDLIINELMTSTSAYMPKVLPTIGDLTRGKVNLFQELIEYCNRNFPSLTLKIIPKLVENLEKANTALNLWITIDADENRIKLKQILETVIKNSNIKIKGGDENILREFFSRRIDAINEILS